MLNLFKKKRKPENDNDGFFINHTGENFFLRRRCDELQDELKTNVRRKNFIVANELENIVTITNIEEIKQFTDGIRGLVADKVRLNIVIDKEMINFLTTHFADLIENISYTIKSNTKS